MHNKRFFRLGVLSVCGIAVSLFAYGFLSSSSASSRGGQVENSLGNTDYVRIVALYANDIVFNPADSKLYVSVPSSAGATGNSITSVDPYAGTVGSPVYIGSEPSRLALAADGQSLYTYLEGAFQVVRFNVSTQSPVGSFPIGYDPIWGILRAGGIAVSPDNANIVAVARQSDSSTRGVAVYDNGVRLPDVGPGSSDGSDYLAFSENGSTLYGTGYYSGLKRYAVSSSGVTLSASSALGSGYRFKHAAGSIFSANGQVIRAADMTLLGTFSGVSGASNRIFVPDTQAGRVFFVMPTGTAGTYSLRAFDINTFTEVGSLTLPNIPGEPTSLVRWGTNGLALGTTLGLVLIQTSLIPTPDPIPIPSPTPTLTPTPTPRVYTAAFRELTLPANDIVYSATRGKLYVTLPSSLGPARGNSITEIEPVTGALGSSTFVGSEPTNIALADDESALFVGINGAGSVRRFDLTNSSLGPLVGLGTSSSGPNTAWDMDVMPGSSNTVAVSRGGEGIAVYDGLVRRPSIGDSGTYVDFASPQFLISNDNNRLTRYSVAAGGLSQTGTMREVTPADILVEDDRIYGGNGRVVDSGLGLVHGSYVGLGPYSNLVAVDQDLRRVFFLEWVAPYRIQAFELDTFRAIGSISVPSFLQKPKRLIRWGANGLAYSTDGKIHLIQSDLVDGGEPVPSPTPPPPVIPTPSQQSTTFVRRVFLRSNDLFYDSGTNSVIASIPGSAGAGLGNTLTHIDPTNGQITGSTFVGSEPTRVVAADDGQTVYTALTGANAVRKYNLVTRTPGLQFTVPGGFSNYNDLAVVPGSPGTLAIAHHTGGVAIYDDGVRRPLASNGGAYSINSIAFSNTPNVLYGHDGLSSAHSLSRFILSPTGATGTLVANNLITGSFTHIMHHAPLLYSTSGQVADPESSSLVGTFQDGGPMAIDPATNRIFYVRGNVLTAYDLQTFVPIGSVTIPGFSGPSSSLARWGTNGLVFRAQIDYGNPDSAIYLIQSTLVSNVGTIPSGISLDTRTHSAHETFSSVAITITRTGQTSTAASVDYATIDGTATAGQDYVARTGTAFFAAGETTTTITIPIIDDDINENDIETFGFNISNVAGSDVVLLEPVSATITIGDNDGQPGVSSVSTNVLEPNLGRTAVANVQVQLTHPSVETITVSFATSAVTASAGTDYTSFAGVLTFAPLETVKTVPVQILPDVLMEPNETFRVNLTNSTNATILPPGVATIQNLNHAAHVFDFDGDSKTDIGIFRPSVGEWWINRSSTGVTTAGQFGASTDQITPGDFTGDGKADIAFWRPSTGEWFVLRSEDGSYFSFPFGTNGDVPVVGDFDGDGKADAGVFRPSTSVWYIRRSSDGGATITQFGAAGDVPVVADYDGDGKADIAIYRPSAGEWWINRSTGGVIAFQFGNANDKPVQGDFTGDGRADSAFWRPSTGEWFILRSEDSSYYSQPFGTTGDIPAPGDYDGDGKFDTTVFRPSQAIWYSQRSTAGTLIQQFGSAGDRPVPNAFVP